MDEKSNLKLLNWIVGNQTGASSKTIWASLMDSTIMYPSIPYDTDDFRRCWELLELCDEETKHKALTEVAKKHEIWKPYVERWRYLTELFTTGNFSELNKVLRALRNQ